jgi:broad specificity phosphatase PhoE
MKPKRIILVRHGQSEGNADKNQYESVHCQIVVIQQLQGLNSRYALITDSPPVKCC